MRAKTDKGDEIEVIHEGKFLRFARKGEWEYFERSNCTAIVIVVAVTQNNEAILVEQYRAPVGKNVIEFTAGLVNDLEDMEHESNLAAAQRELFEEAGYRSDEWEEVLQGPMASGSSADLVTIFIARNAQKVGEGGGDEMESIVAHTVPLDSIDAWLDQKKAEGCLVEPKIYTGLYLLSSYNK